MTDTDDVRDSRSTKRPRVFISFSSGGAEYALEIARALTSHRIEVRTGGEFSRHGPNAAEIRQWIRDSAAFLAIISRDYLQSELVWTELAEVVSTDAVIIPVKIDQHAEIPALLTPYQHFELTDDSRFDEGIYRLAEYLTALTDNRESTYDQFNRITAMQNILRDEESAYVNRELQRKTSRAQQIATGAGLASAGATTAAGITAGILMGGDGLVFGPIVGVAVGALTGWITSKNAKRSLDIITGGRASSR